MPSGDGDVHARAVGGVSTSVTLSIDTAVPSLSVSRGPAEPRLTPVTVPVTLLPASLVPVIERPSMA